LIPNWNYGIQWPPLPSPSPRLQKTLGFTRSAKVTPLYGTQSRRNTVPPPPAMARFHSSANITAVPARRCELSAPTSGIGEIFRLRLLVGSFLSINSIIHPVEAQNVKYLFRREAGRFKGPNFAFPAISRPFRAPGRYDSMGGFYKCFLFYDLIFRLLKSPFCGAGKAILRVFNDLDPLKSGIRDVCREPWMNPP